MQLHDEKITIGVGFVGYTGTAESSVRERVHVEHHLRRIKRSKSRIPPYKMEPAYDIDRVRERAVEEHGGFRFLGAWVAYGQFAQRQSAGLTECGVNAALVAAGMTRVGQVGAGDWRTIGCCCTRRTAGGEQVYTHLLVAYTLGTPPSWDEPPDFGITQHFVPVPRTPPPLEARGSVVARASVEATADAMGGAGTAPRPSASSLQSVQSASAAPLGRAGGGVFIGDGVVDASVLMMLPPGEREASSVRFRVN